MVQWKLWYLQRNVTRHLYKSISVFPIILSYPFLKQTFWWRKKKERKILLFEDSKNSKALKKKKTPAHRVQLSYKSSNWFSLSRKRRKKDGNEEIDCSVIILAKEGRGRRESISVPQRGTRTPVFPRSGEGFTGWRQTRAPIFRGSEGRGVHVSGCKYNRRVSRGKVKWPWRAVVHAE